MSKELEALEVIYDSQDIQGGYDDFWEAYRNIEKAVKALEIIKREPSEVIETITTYDTWEEYIKDYPVRDKTIWHIIKNKNEFDLLKEVFYE